MTEAEWFASDNPESMYEVVRDVFRPKSRWKRKHDFFGAACCRLVWPWIEPDERTRSLVEYMENQFDLGLTEQQQRELEDRLSAQVHLTARHPWDGTPELQNVAANLVYDAGSDGITEIRYLLHSFDEWGDVKKRATEIAAIMRDIYGNPFRSVTFNPSWRTSTVRGLASAIYAERAFDRLPILADALEDAGCDSPDLLAHCRSDSPHVRGCWAVDLILGKS